MAERELYPDREQRRRIMDFIMAAGQTLLENGAEVFRVEQTMEIMAASFHLREFHVYVLTNGIFASAGTAEMSEVRNVPTRTTHLGRVAAVNQLSRQIASGEVETVAEAEARLAQARCIPFPKDWVQLAAGMGGAFCFALIFGGGYGWLLNKIKGGEMMIATYVGFSSVSFMCMMWLLLPYSSPTMVWGLSGKGLRTTISLEGFYDKALANFLQINIGKISIPTGSLLFFAFLAFLMWAFLHTKTGTAMTAVGSNPNFARASGINIDKTRMLSVIMSTWLAAVGILMYEQGFGFIQLYMAPFYMALPAVSAILIGGASVNKASITNVIIGTFLFQGIVTMTPTVMNSMIHMDMSEVIRIVVSNGMILYALTRKTEGSK